LNFQFSDPFWKDKSITNGKDLAALHFLFSTQPIPTWWTQHPQKEALLVGWLGGPAAQGFTSATKDAVVEKAVKSLAQLFCLDYNLLEQKIVGAEWYNWSGDKHFCGAYSYNVINGRELIQTIIEPAKNAVYFAGEGLHTGNGIGTVEAALASGRDVAHQLVTDF
jgi:monoamine oxidase